MKLERFFEKFELFAEAPNAVARMRKVILHLAVRGALVSQSPSDEPAIKLAERIIAVRFSSEKAKKRYEKAGFLQIPEESQPYKIPSSWVWMRLGESTFIRTGKLDANASTLDGEYPFFTCARDPLRIDHYAYDGECVLLAGNGNFDVNYYDGKFEAYQRTYIIEAVKRELVAGGYLFRFIQLYADTLREMSIGGVISYIKIGFLTEAPFPLPPLAEQKRIVAKVDELMALCDQLEAQQQERQTRHAALVQAGLARFTQDPTPANLQFLFHSSYTVSPADLRKTILTLAVQGKLVDFNIDIKEQTVGDHIEFQNGYAFKSEWFKPSGIRLCRNANVSHGVLDWQESAFVDDEVAKEFNRFSLSEGDIVLSLDRPIIATGLKVARVRKSDLPCLLLQRVARPFPKHGSLDMDYFMLWLNSSEFVDSIDPGRSNGVPHISTRQVQRLPFILPPLAEQRRIVTKVDELLALVDELETQLVASRTVAQNLLAALVRELTTTP